jgi:hypothetical protein
VKKLLLLVAFLALSSPVLAAGDLAVAPTVTTISSGTSLSPAIDLGPNRTFAVVMPAAWTAAALTFQASIDGTNYFNVFDDTGTEVTATVAASQYIVIASPAKMLGVRWIKVRSGTSGAPVNQGADRALTIVGVP